MNKKLHLLVASIVFSSLAHADDYASPAFIPVSASGGDANGQEESVGEPLSCSEARDTAWFIRELSRTDGDTNPDVEYTPCGREVLAKAAVDYD
jgi:hypothetical protein